MNSPYIHFTAFRFVFLKSPPSCPSPSSLFFSKYIYVWLCWVFVALVLLWLQGVEAALRFGTRTPLCGGVSCRAAQGLAVCGTWNLPGPGIEPLSPALAGRCLITRATGKPHFIEFLAFLLQKKKC